MKVALIADIHGNCDALESVVRHAHSKGVHRFWVLGDLLGYGPEPNQVITYLQQLPADIIIGNYDRRLLEVRNEQSSKSSPRTLLKRLLFDWTAQEMQADNLVWLGRFSSEKIFSLENHKVLLVHGVPGNDELVMNEDTPMEELEYYANESGADFICAGHSHQVFDKMAGSTRFLNPGSLGRPEDGRPEASYATLDLTGPCGQVEFHRVPYDYETTASKVQAHHLPFAVAEIYRRGKRLKEVLQSEPEPHADLFEDRRVLAAARFAEKHYYHSTHEEQVTQVASQLFDAIWDQHGLGREEKALLLCAAYTHDIGWVGGQQKHHKRSRNLILKDKSMPLDPQERIMVALIARYHRRAEPKPTHSDYNALSRSDKLVINKLSPANDGVTYTSTS